MKNPLLIALLAFTGTLSLAAAEPLKVDVEAPNISWGNGPTLVWAKHFHVLVTNISDTPQRIWQDWNSWGWDNLKVEFTDPDGKITIAVKSGNIWTANAPTYCTLAPHEVHVFDIDHADPAQWQGFPALKNERKSFTIRAIYASGESTESKKENVWIGKIASEPIKVLIVSSS